VATDQAIVAHRRVDALSPRIGPSCCNLATTSKNNLLLDIRVFTYRQDLADIFHVGGVRVRYRDFDVWAFERQSGKWRALIRSTENVISGRRSGARTEMATWADAKSAQDAILMAMTAIDDLQNGAETLAASRQLGHRAVARIRSKSFALSGAGKPPLR
jgi:hypothetical protein